MDTVSDVSQAHVVMIPLIVTTIAALILTVLRMYVRIWVVKLLGWDDFFNVLAMVMTLVVMGLVFGAVQCGLGRHFKFLDPARASKGVMYLRIAEFFLIISTVFVKISISLFLKRLFTTSKTWARFFTAFIAFNTITSLLDAAVIFPQCTPVQLNWDKSIPGHCWSDEAINAVGIAQGSIAAATDVVLSVIPTLFLWNIKISWKIKVGICTIMALGFASGGFAVARTALVPSLTATHDPTWDLVPLFTWAVLEATFGVIAAAAPSVRPLLRLGTDTSGYSKSHSHSHSFPLHHMQSGNGPRNLVSVGRSVARDPHDLPEEDMPSDSGSGDVTLWTPSSGNGILKTTNVHIVRSTPVNDEKPHNSSIEKLVN